MRLLVSYNAGLFNFGNFCLIHFSLSPFRQCVMEFALLPNFDLKTVVE